MTSGRPGASNPSASPSRTANSIAMPSASSRRAVNSSASAEAVSSHWASSMMHRNGCSVAASASRPRVAA